MNTWRVLVGDVREQLRLIPDASVQCCVTSPPYWGLRDYGTATWEGGDPACDHRKGAVNHKDSRSTLVGTTTTQNHSQESWGDTCRKCGARRIDSQIGLEPTPDAFVAEMVAVFREVRRVLKDDGVLWLNLGDTYAGGGQYRGGGRDKCSDKQKSNRGSYHQVGKDWTPPTLAILKDGYKPKDLIGIPWRVAFALQADGWYLRSDIIWHKPNPMPESVTDRPTKAHEYVFLLTKSPRYYYDGDAVSEPSLTITQPRMRPNGLSVVDSKAMGGAPNCGVDETRNARTVWTITTQPYPEAHFATFPEELPTRCIRAGSKPGDLVLDPFTGSGTTGHVALKLGRSFVGCELNPQYAELARTRIGGAAPLFSEEMTA